MAAAATLVISDSGGIQEEAPSFGVPVLVLRDVTEQMAAVDARCALLLGTDRGRVTDTATRLLTDEDARRAMTASGSPFGDGFAAERAEQAVAWLLGLAAEPVVAAGRQGEGDAARATTTVLDEGAAAGFRGCGRSLDLQDSPSRCRISVHKVPAGEGQRPTSTAAGRPHDHRCRDRAVRA
ncbi:UDP-N-acetylglucosamine 2-epimerase [Amycolatopsis mongoliensis]|uniref:UDP-N-acetylglucosamine 2-epimerase (non-hydrolyzing) n=1 Tax=Amycolatopsis mongoliensis TaxID=715475 RepID=A0A9Y2NDJ4_9PSEU|nr:UDP-N-acetylglucosamine 2-epimerase [Amycolatopsis sp. 4-36]WIY00752.1 UDP-N-acetylglucosamine 2-epimerase [Amycolatopsis sp. 4-36]